MDDSIDIDESTMIRVPTNVLARRAADETVLLDLTSETYFGLNAVGSRVWELAQPGASVGAVVTTLLEEFEVERDVLVADVAALLRSMAVSGLVVLDAA
jgi:Coenzyme PQQ synthesis protein D (PqqD)